MINTIEQISLAGTASSIYAIDAAEVECGWGTKQECAPLAASRTGKGLVDHLRRRVLGRIAISADDLVFEVPDEGRGIGLEPRITVRWQDVVSADIKADDSQRDAAVLINEQEQELGTKINRARSNTVHICKIIRGATRHHLRIMTTRNVQQRRPTMASRA